MVFVHAHDIGSDDDILQRITQEVAHHSNVASLWQFDQDGDVGAMAPQGVMRRVPDPFPTVNFPVWRYFDPIGVELVTLMAKPLGCELPHATVLTALDQELAFFEAIPKRGRQTIGLRNRNRESFGKVVLSCCVCVHRVASDPRSKLLAGVTIGPPMTNATSWRRAWRVEVPRICLAASTTSSNPCT